MSTIADNLALLQRTKAGQRALLEEMYPDMDFSTVPFREYGRLFTGRKYVPGFVGGWKAYGRSNSEDASTRDILPDYSENGRDIELFNFGWTEDSGYNTTTYPGALVSDGIDDYGQCIKGFSLPDDYTIVMIRRIIKGNSAALASKGASEGAFLFEVLNNTNKSGVVWSYGQTNGLADAPDLFSYQTKGTYNGRGISYGIAEDTSDDILSIFRYSAANHMSAALYDLRIYDHSLTAEELAAVKDEMMTDYENATGGGIADIHYVADWDGKGRSNDEEEPMRSQWIDKKTGRLINLSNFGFAGMSGWGGYAQDFSAGKIISSYGTLSEKSGSRVTIRRTGGNESNILFIVNNYKNIAYRMKASADVNIRYYDNDSQTGGRLMVLKGGEIMDVPQIGVPFTDVGLTPVIQDVDVTIEQLPLYPGALVSDGVDDYGQTAEAVSEEIGTIILDFRFIREHDRGEYLFNTSSGENRMYIYKASDGNVTQGVPYHLLGTYDEIPRINMHLRPPGNPASPLYLFSYQTSSELAQAVLYRLILIREQLDAAQVEFLKWKVDKEYRDWCKSNGYEYAINQLTE